MPIQIVMERIDGVDLSCTEVFCDACGQRIVQAAEGMYAWWYECTTDTTDGALVYWHKQPCSRPAEAAEQARRGPGWHLLWQELRTLPDYLRANLEEGG